MKCKVYSVWGVVYVMFKMCGGVMCARKCFLGNALVCKIVKVSITLSRHMR